MEDVTELCLRAFHDSHKEDSLGWLAKVWQPDQTLIHYAAWHGWQDACQEPVESYHFSPSDKTDIFLVVVCRPLHLACDYGGVEVIKYLLTFSPVLLSVDECDGSVCFWSECP